MLTKTEAQKSIADLIDRFDDQKEFYQKTSYNETLARRDFIDPFFEALGWDIANKNGYAESYREVIHEDRIKIGKATKAPDYSFRLGGGRRLFFVEAKKPSVLIKSDIIPAYQVRRYGWSAKLPVSIITDFEEFAVYDCSKKPNPADKASTARLKYFTYTDYLNNFDFIWDTFSKERVLKGGLDKFIKSDTHKRGTATVDYEFLQSLDRWRTYLATSIAINNKHLDEDEINFAVQQTIDRIIFLRIAEDRSIEPYGNLKHCIKDGSLYQNLFDVFIKADQKYNSGLFDFNKDKISRNLQVDNKVVKTIINELYYPECPYEFAVLPVEILGTAYEQFLGKQIRINPGHTVTIEEKPAVRKSGGVYYTPQYIVDYIVKNTLGKLIDGRAPKDISKLKIVDPACGSGSFLIGAYQYLLDHHKSYYTSNGKVVKTVKNNPLTPDGNLTTAEKKRILLNNIYGVDIDVNAVEVTKLSLLLKCMEGETEASIAMQMKLFHDRVLPTLDNNIKSGNSLIDFDYYDDGAEDDKKIKPFSWQKSFPNVFKQGGFDCIIGNPPYVQPTVLEKDSQAYLSRCFLANTDLYSIFIEQSLKLLKTGNDLGFIVPSLFIKGVRYQNLRDLINLSSKAVTIAEQGDRVFDKVQMPTCIILLTKGAGKKGKDFFTNQSHRLFEKIETIPLGNISETKRGLEIGKDKLQLSGLIRCLSGSSIDVYAVKNERFITKEILKKFSKEAEMFESPKIMVRETGNKFFATIDYDDSITTRSIYNTRITDQKYSAEYILGIINSSLFRFYFKQFVSPETNVFPKIRIVQLKELPVPKVVNKEQKQQTEAFARQIISLKKDLLKASLANKTDHINSRIEYAESKLNSLVYELYKLTKEEINLIEEALNM